MRRQVPPDEPIYVATQRSDLVTSGAPLLYVLTERRSATRYDIAAPGVVTSAPVQREIVASLESEGLPLVLRWNASITAAPEPNRAGRSTGVRILDRYLERAYREAGSLWLLRDPGASAPSAMSVGLYISAIAFLAATLVPLVLAAVQFRRVALPGWSGPPARVAEAVVAIGLMTLVAQALGAVGLLERVPLVVLSLVVGIGAGWALRRRAPGPPQKLPAPPPDPLAVALALGAAALVCGAWVARVEASLDGGMIGVDTLWYHLPAAARFAQEGSIAHVHFFDGEPVTAYYPANSSLLHAVGMVLTKRDLLSPVMNLGWLALALVSAWSIGRPRGRGPEAVLASAVLLGTPTIVTTQPGEAYTDVVGVALLLAAGALIVNADGRRAAFALAAVAAGVGLGAKFTMVAPALALTLGVVLLAPRGRRLAYAASFGLITLAFGGYWYARNLFAVGNPLPAADLSLGPLTLPSPEIGTPTYTVAQYLFDGRVWDDYFLPGLDFAFGPAWWAMLALAVAGMLLALVRGPTRAHRLLGLVALLTAGSFVFTPQFLGVDGAPVFFRFNLRYVSPALVLGLVLLPLAPALNREVPRRALALVLGAVLVAAQVDSGIWPSRADRAAVVAGVIVLAVGGARDRRRAPRYAGGPARGGGVCRSGDRPRRGLCDGRPLPDGSLSAGRRHRCGAAAPDLRLGPGNSRHADSPVEYVPPVSACRHGPLQPRPIPGPPRAGRRLRSSTRLPRVALGSGRRGISIRGHRPPRIPGPGHRRGPARG